MNRLTAELQKHKVYEEVLKIVQPGANGDGVLSSRG